MWNVVLFKATSENNSGEKESDKFLTNLRKLEIQKLVSSVSLVPVLDFQFQSLDTFYRHIKNSDQYDGLILTSLRSVESIKKSTEISPESRLDWETILRSKWSGKYIFCVGLSTLSTAQNLLGINSETTNLIYSKIGTSEDLASLILKHSEEKSTRLPLLYPCGSLKTDTLSTALKNGSIPFHTVTTYSTVENRNIRTVLDSITSYLPDGEEAGTIYIFFSPSGVKFTLPHLTQLTEKYLVALGPTTRAALERESGIDQSKIYQCANPTPEALNDIVTLIISSPLQLHKPMAEHDSFMRKAVKDWKYIYPDATRKEVIDILKFWKGLKPIVGDFVFGNGQKKKLIALSGTIPINYRGACYHIPVEIWLLDTFPSNAPLVYVRPTANMRIKPSRHVDNSGKVYLPFLHSWKPDCGINALIQVLICTFEEQPPVFAVPTQPVAQPMLPQPMSLQQSATGIPNVPYPLQQTAYPIPYPPSPYPTGMPMPAIPSIPQSTAQISNNSTVSSVHIRVSLLSAVSEKLTRRLEDIYFTTEIEIKTGEQLKEGQTKLERMMRHLDDEKSSIEKTITTCEKEIEQLDDKISKQNNENTAMNIDDAIQAPTPLYKQIVNAFVEEAALEDTIYYLSEGFRSGKMDLEQFQKHIRILSRKQFMLRAMLKKCRQKAGLAG